MTSNRFRDLLLELVDEDPFALRAVLKLLRLEFTSAVPTLAVTCEARPRLLVNLAFVGEQCRTDAQVKAVICHELLHVLLRHTERGRALTPARHLAFDAVINAIVHRELGPACSSMMTRYYAAAEGPMKLLRPPLPAEEKRNAAVGAAQLDRAWNALYQGRLVADDIEALATDVAPHLGGAGAGAEAELTGSLLGDHQGLGEQLVGTLADALDEAMARMNGAGIWRAPKSRGVGASPYPALFQAADTRVLRWERTALAILRRHLSPDPRSRAADEPPRDYCVPVLSPGDRRAFLRSLWDPFLPEARWRSSAPRHTGSAQVYLDVSGSMNAEMPVVIRLLARLSAHIRRPFWAFSDEVAPAVIERGQLRCATSGGTSLSCVLRHLAKTRPRAAVVVTDGWIENVDPGLVSALAGVRLHALVTRDGDPSALRRAGIPYSQLERLPS